MKYFILICICAASLEIFSQAPVFGNEIPVTINGYTLDAMEPFISPDGNAMFFNSLNDGNTTSLYYAGKVNDSTFNLVGPVPVVNQTVTPRLDAVASLDTSNNFYWVSTRNYPADYDNLQRIRFLQPGYTNFGRVHGNIYIYSPGWIIMDAAINNSGDKLIYCNAWFNNCNFGMPCISALALAQKVNDSTFSKLPNSGSLLANVNDTSNYIVYAPQLSKDELELYYTHALKNNPQTEICVAVRSNTNSAFSSPTVIYALSGNIPEGPTITSDKSKLYYHRKSGAQYKLFLRKRAVLTGLKEEENSSILKIYPNPNYGILEAGKSVEMIEIVDMQGNILLSRASKSLDISGLQPGIYIARLFSAAGVSNQKFIFSAKD
jgi:hypothetical protein